MSHPAQVTVIVSIVGVDDQSQVYYTYTDPALSQVVIRSELSVTFAVSPFHVLFSLDYPSTRAGWRFKRHIIDKVGITEHERARNKMSMLTVYDGPQPCKSFYLGFSNRFTCQDVWDDPQEGNVRPPT